MANEEEREQIVIPDENGEEHLFEKIYEFTVDATGKSYIMVAPVGTPEDLEDEEVDVMAFRYEEGDKEDDLALYQIESDEEWDMIEEVWNTLSEDDLM